MIRFMTSRPSSRTIGVQPTRLRALVPTLGLLAMISVLSYQALQGERGLRGWQDLAQQRAAKDKQLQSAQQMNAELNARIARLSADSLDLDYLDERARIVLGLVQDDEKVVFNRHLRRN
jgi:cell division protein FtsB